MGQIVQAHGYELDPKKKYLIDLDYEMSSQLNAIIPAVMMHNPKAIMKDYHEWLKKNNFDINMPNPTNELVGKFYGKEALWKTDRSIGIVVKNDDENDEDYYILMECSRLVEGFKYTKIILTPAGCI